MADDRMSGHEARQRMGWGVGIALGMGIGVAMGSALGNMGLGIGIGLGVGVAFAVAFGMMRGGTAGAGEDVADVEEAAGAQQGGQPEAGDPGDREEDSDR
ncbi:hypothetical protein [Microbacterium tumbae]